MNVELHIERLVIEGLDIRPGQAADLRAAVETELASLLRGRAAAGMAEKGRADAPVAPMQVESLQPAQFGPRIAAAVLARIDLMPGGGQDE
ncbi:hypothetical protein FNU76_23115 [Chitinimonas arctica]|uniref:Uncharacterized protein n=1 Tax=Chitinimonas arctica TaxID=2594795 RepID=A0A516SLJ0_9NEIS|nr:hypothetical protein [Chitinimonas arctica]QDQ29003.1 hypothetical protein FNU76_23115 [Chitinimonas arctica]